MSGWLIRFGLGGVQQFIADSRKLRDFEAASRLLSDLCEAVAEDIRSRALVILPVTEAKRETQPLKLPFRPNQVTVRADVDAEGARAIGARMSDVARGWWLSEASSAVKKNGHLLSPNELATPADVRTQLETALQVYWVAVECEADTTDGRRAFQALAHAFDARRHTRTFAQMKPLVNRPENWACSQCGARPAVTNAPERNSFPLDSTSERLCAVCLTKRSWERRPRPDSPPQTKRFESTHQVARNRYWRDPGLSGVRQATAQVDKKFLGIDDADPAELADAAKKLRSQDFRSLGHWLAQIDDRCSPYYALVRFDGDEMGKWFSDPERFKDGTTLEDARRALGESLVVFADTLRKGVDGCGATLVYAGGDDGFVIAPIDSVLGVLRVVRDLWNESVSELRPRVKGQPPTLSLHASIVHAKTPLQPALARVQALLKQTKTQGDRNAFSILADIRAGASALLICKWAELEHLIAAVTAVSNWRPRDASVERCDDLELQRRIEAVERLHRLRGHGRFPARLLHNLADAVPPFFDPGTGRVRYERELRNEMARVASRSGGKDVATRHAASLDWFVQRASGIRSSSGVAMLAGEETLRSTFKVVGFLARELSWKPIRSVSAGVEPARDRAAYVE